MILPHRLYNCNTTLSEVEPHAHSEHVWTMCEDVSCAFGLALTLKSPRL